MFSYLYKLYDSKDFAHFSNIVSQAPSMVLGTE